MKVLVTGATGLLGGTLLPELQRRGEEVRVLVLPSEDATRLEAQGIGVVRGDVTDTGSLPAAVRDVELVFHLAGMMGVDRPLEAYRAVNVTGSANLYRAACSAGVRRFVHISSHTVYGLGHGRPHTEEDRLQPDPDPYSITKAQGDHRIRQLMHESDVETVIVRPGTFFGPNDHLHFGRIAARLRAAKGVIIGSGQNALPFCYVTDVVQGLLLAGYHPAAAGNVYNITNDRPLTQQQLLNAVADSVGGRRPTRRLPYFALYNGAAWAERVARLTRTKPVVTRLGVLMFGSDTRHSLDKARRELGYEPRVELLEGIRLAAEWYNAGARADAGRTTPAGPLAEARKQ